MTVAVTGGEATVSMGMEVDGEIQDLPFPMEMDLPSDTVEGSGQFECTDATLTVTMPPKARTARNSTSPRSSTES